MTQEQLAMIFEEWDRRYREEPEKFQSEAEHLLKSTAAEYGERAAAYFMVVWKDLDEVHT